MPKVNQPTIKERKFVQAYIATDGNGTASAREAYGVEDRGVASAMGSQTLARPRVQELLLGELDRVGVNTQTVAKRHAELLYSDDDKISVDAMKEYYKITGAYAPKRAENLRVNVTLEDIIEQRKKKHQGITGNTAPIQ